MYCYLGPLLPSNTGTLVQCYLGPLLPWATATLGHCYLGPLLPWAIANLGHCNLDALATLVHCYLGALLPWRTVTLVYCCPGTLLPLATAAPTQVPRVTVILVYPFLGSPPPRGTATLGHNYLTGYLTELPTWGPASCGQCYHEILQL